MGEKERQIRRKDGWKELMERNNEGNKANREEGMNRIMKYLSHAVLHSINF
jgi:hypothetical protein